MQPISLDNVPLTFQTKVKNLGVYLDQTLSGELWVRHVCRRVFALLNRFYRCGATFLPPAARRTLVNTLILPIFDYGGPLHVDLTVDRENRLQRAQNSSVRFAYRLRRRFALTPIFKDWGLMRLADRRKWQLLVLFYKSVVRDGGPSYIKEKCMRFSEHHGHAGKCNHSFVSPRVRTCTFQFMAIKLWNAPVSSLHGQQWSICYPLHLQTKITQIYLNGVE